MSEWKPIESAPKDGTHVLLYFRFAGDRFMAEGWWAPAGHWSVHGDSGVRATHWKPLDTPPDAVSEHPEGTPTVFEDCTFYPPPGFIVPPGIEEEG